MSILTQQKLEAILEHNVETSEWFNVLSAELGKHEINTVPRIASFVSQCAHESGDFRVMKENLNYSAEALNKVFKKYFPTLESAYPYNRKPFEIANKVYANRMGNGDQASGDGFKYRGRGLIQITGKDNYRKCSLALYNDERLLDNPDFLLTKLGAVQSACWFWTANKINPVADTGDVAKVTKIINGGTNGLDHRAMKYKMAMSVLQG
jgi:putative chitinase